MAYKALLAHARGMGLSSEALSINAEKGDPYPFRAATDVTNRTFYYDKNGEEVKTVADGPTWLEPSDLPATSYVRRALEEPERITDSSRSPAERQELLRRVKTRREDGALSWARKKEEADQADLKERRRLINEERAAWGAPSLEDEEAMYRREPPYIPHYLRPPDHDVNFLRDCSDPNCGAPIIPATELSSKALKALIEEEEAALAAAEKGRNQRRCRRLMEKHYEGSVAVPMEFEADNSNIGLINANTLNQAQPPELVEDNESEMEVSEAELEAMRMSEAENNFYGEWHFKYALPKHPAEKDINVDSSDVNNPFIPFRKSLEQSKVRRGTVDVTTRSVDEPCHDNELRIVDGKAMVSDAGLRLPPMDIAKNHPNYPKLYEIMPPSAVPCEEEGIISLFPRKKSQTGSIQGPPDLSREVVRDEQVRHRARIRPAVLALPLREVSPPSEGAHMAALSLCGASRSLMLRNRATGRIGGNKKAPMNNEPAGDSTEAAQQESPEKLLREKHLAYDWQNHLKLSSLEKPSVIPLYSSELTGGAMACKKAENDGAEGSEDEATAFQRSVETYNPEHFIKHVTHRWERRLDNLRAINRALRTHRRAAGVDADASLFGIVVDIEGIPVEDPEGILASSDDSDGFDHDEELEWRTGEEEDDRGLSPAREEELKALIDALPVSLKERMGPLIALATEALSLKRWSTSEIYSACRSLETKPGVTSLPPGQAPPTNGVHESVHVFAEMLLRIRANIIFNFAVRELQAAARQELHDRIVAAVNAEEATAVAQEAQPPAERQFEGIEKPANFSLSALSAILREGHKQEQRKHPARRDPRRNFCALTPSEEHLIWNAIRFYYRLTEPLHPKHWLSGMSHMVTAHDYANRPSVAACCLMLRAASDFSAPIKPLPRHSKNVQAKPDLLSASCRDTKTSKWTGLDSRQDLYDLLEELLGEQSEHEAADPHALCHPQVSGAALVAEDTLVHRAQGHIATAPERAAPLLVAHHAAKVRKWLNRAAFLVRKRVVALQECGVLEPTWEQVNVSGGRGVDRPSKVPTLTLGDTVQAMRGVLDWKNDGELQ